MNVIDNMNPFFSSVEEPPVLAGITKPNIYEDDDVAVEDTPPPTKGKVYLLNDDTHSFNEVIKQVMLAIQCGIKKATRIAETVHTVGKCIVKEGSIQECLEVSAILEEISLKTQIVM